MTRRPLLAVVAASLIAAACDTPASPTDPTAIIVTQSLTELFTGALKVRDARFYSYTVNQPGTVTVTLASLTTGNARPITNRVMLGIGIPAGTGCRVDSQVVTSASLVSQLQRSSTPGIYCVNVADVDGLPAEAAFAVRIVHP